MQMFELLYFVFPTVFHFNNNNIFNYFQPVIIIGGYNWNKHAQTTIVGAAGKLFIGVREIVD